MQRMFVMDGLVKCVGYFSGRGIFFISLKTVAAVILFTIGTDSANSVIRIIGRRTAIISVFFIF